MWTSTPSADPSNTPEAGAGGWGVFVACVAVALTISLVLRFWWQVPLGLSFLLTFVGWPLVGTLVTADDDLPGGWSNPDGDRRPPWLEAEFWGFVASGLALSAAGFAVDAGWRWEVNGPFWLATLALALLATALLTRRWWLLFAAAGTVAAIGLR